VASGLSAEETTRLVAAARKGDRAAFGALYDSYWRLVHGVLLANVDRDDVQDLIQDVFFAGLQKIGSLKDGAAFGAWISAIARNQARMLHRERREMVAVPDDLASTARSDDELATAEIMGAIRSLPENYRVCLLLRLVHEMSGEEIAERLGLTHGTVRVYLHHGFAQLRGNLREDNG
jgi:RNA polymerase sigma-70 factor (ECF subfamily)